MLRSRVANVAQLAFVCLPAGTLHELLWGPQFKAAVKQRIGRTPAATAAAAAAPAALAALAEPPALTAALAAEPAALAALAAAPPERRSNVRVQQVDQSMNPSWAGHKVFKRVCSLLGSVMFTLVALTPCHMQCVPIIRAGYHWLGRRQTGHRELLLLAEEHTDCKTTVRTSNSSSGGRSGCTGRGCRGPAYEQWQH